MPGGKRREAERWSEAAPWAANLEGLLRTSSTHGYTGHEMAEAVGVIHMNGRLYDPHFGRFLQADPLVQSPQNLQSWNRYSYAFNNPLAYTDPSGHMSVGDWARMLAAAAITMYSGGIAAGASWGLFGASITAGSAQSFAICPAREGTTGYYDKANNVRVIVNSENGNVVTAIPGGPK